MPTHYGKNLRLKLNQLILMQEFIKKGDILKRHKDRFSCEISTTMNLGDDWGIYLSPNENVGILNGKKNYNRK